MTTRDDIVRVARSYLGTPWHHMARQPGIGIDCAGVLICAGRELGILPLDFDVPAYTPNPDGRSMMAWCNQSLDPIDSSVMRAGDIVVLKTDALPQHLGILGDHRHGGLSLIHASNSTRPARVIETRLMFSRALRLVAVYRFRGIA